MKPLEIGLLDFGIRTPGMHSTLCVADLMEYAMKGDELGFSRFWISEHHLPDMKMSWSNPTILVPLLAGMTTRMKIGVAGILLGIHQPYHVASNFKMLSNLYPGRIDLGLANGRVTTDVSEIATGVKDLKMSQAFSDNLKKLSYLLNDEEELLRIGTVIPPYKGMLPNLWSLTTTLGKSLQWALDYKMNLARSIFHKGSDKSLFREEILFFKSKFFERYHLYPQINLVVSGAIHRSDTEVKAAVLPSMEGFEYNILGTPDQFEDTFYRFQEDYGCDEIIFLNVALKPKDRIIGLELLSETFKLNNSTLIQ